MASFEASPADDWLLYELMPTLIGIGPKGKLLAYGSCFVVWPHIAVTARHVIEELQRTDPNIAKGLPAIFDYWLVQVERCQDETFKYIVWTIDHLALSSHSDIAVIWLKAWNDHAFLYRRWKTLPVTLDVPPVGSLVKVFGMHNLRFKNIRLDAEQRHDNIEYDFERSVSTGKVREHYWGGRDRSMYPFPCFEIDARIEHGMSGGLVLNDRGEICGIACGSLPPSAPDEDHVSYITMLWPLMAMPVKGKFIQDADSGKQYRMQDLAARGIFAPEG